MLSDVSYRRFARKALLSLCFVACYILLTHSDIILETRLGFTVWYPPTGLSFAFMLGFGPWWLPLVALGDGLSAIFIYHQQFFSWSVLVGAPGVAASYALAAALLRGPLRIDPGLTRRRDVVRYVVVVLAAAVPATFVGITTLFADHKLARADLLSSSVGWYCGDAIALLGVAPFFLVHVVLWLKKRVAGEQLLLCRNSEVSHKTVLSRTAEIVEAAGQALSIVAAIWLAFSGPFAGLQLYYLCLLPLLWIAMRNGITRVVTAIIALDFGIVLALRVLAPPGVSLPRIEALMLLASFTALSLGSEASERQRVKQRLSDQTSYLKSLVENSPFGITVLDREGRVELCNPALEKLLLLKEKDIVGNNLDFVLSAGNDEHAQGFAALALTDKVVQKTLRLSRPDGKTVELELNSVPLVRHGKVDGAYTVYEDVSDRARAEERVRQHAQSLQHQNLELQVHNTQMALLNELGNFLQCCATTEEAHLLVSQYGRKLFPESSGGILYEIKASKNVVQSMATWGNPASSDLSFAPDDCWGLRRGQPHQCGSGETSVSCRHIHAAAPAHHLCVPMAAQGDTIGLFYLQYDSLQLDDALVIAQQRIAGMLAGHVALSLGNLKLREKLRDQSIRDPLTGLFNRRFMEESLERELQRATRTKRSLAVILVDLDHFKRFNDNFGHAAGDVVLKSAAETFQHHFRADDVICRQGGEEFAIILPESSAKDAAIRAEKLRIQFQDLRMRFQERTLDPVTISIGIAGYPEHASTAEELLRLADKSLYQSKAQGRNRVTIAQTEPVPLP